MIHLDLGRVEREPGQEEVAAVARPDASTPARVLSG